jgi:hypothetical protein
MTGLDRRSPAPRDRETTINGWWRSDPEQRFWLEITERDDIGDDLNAPQRGDNGREFWGYTLIKELSPGDVVFHYQKRDQAIVAWSVAAGGVWEDEVLWGARGASAREHGIEPYPRPGWRAGIEHLSYLPEPISLTSLRKEETAIRAIHDDLHLASAGSLYFPLAISDRRPLRPTQGYLAKLPKEIVNLFPALGEAASAAELLDEAVSPAVVDQPQGHAPGATYRPASEETSVSKRDPFSVDPALVERGIRGHAVTQNRLAAFVTEQGSEPRSPRAGEPNFDLLWESDGKVFVAEIKSLTKRNEEKQLRLGLGQVLRYRHVLQNDRDVTAVLVGERRPTDEGWIDLCAQLGVLLLSPPNFKAP